MEPRDDDVRLDAGLQRKAALLAAVLALIALIVGSLFGDRGMLRLIEQKERTGALERQIDELRSENLLLIEEIHALKTDPRAVERVAREELDLARPEETVYLVREQPLTDAR